MGNQPDDLRAAVVAGVPEVTQQHTAFAFISLGVVKALEHASDVLVAFDITCGGVKMQPAHWR